MEKIGKLILSNQKVNDKDIADLFLTILKKSSDDNKDDCSEKSDKKVRDLLEIKRQWKILADLWINSSGPKEIHIGRQLVYFLRTEVMTYVQNSLPWRELEFLVTMFLLRHQRKLSDDEIILCDLSISRKFLSKCVSDFTEQFEKFESSNFTKSKNCTARSQFIKSLREKNYPRIDEIMDKFTHLRRFRSLVQIREMLQEIHQSPAEFGDNNENQSYFLCLAKITNLLQNTVSSPHFPKLDEVSIENMLMPAEMSTHIIQRCRYVFGHMVSLKTNDTSFAKLTPILKNLEPIINVLLENEKRIVVMKFLNRVLSMEINDFKSEVEQFDEHNVPWFELDDSKNKAHTDLLDKIIKNWEGLKKEYKYLKPQIVETGSLEYISEMLKSFRNLYEIMANEFNDRVNPLLIKIANFKLARDDSSKETIFNNIKTSMDGYKNWYRYQKSLNIQLRISSVLFIMKKSFAADENRKIILQGIEEIENFEEFSKLKELPENCSPFLKDLFNKLNAEENPKNTQKKSSPFELAMKRLEIHKTLLEDIEKIDDFCKFSDLEKLQDYCSEFLGDVFKDFNKDVIKKADKKKALFKTGFMMFLECLQSDKNIDQTEVSKVLKNYWIDLKGHYEQLKSNGILSAKNLEACFVTGMAIKQLMKPKPNEGKTKEIKMVLDWIPVLEGSSLRNFIVHNNHLLLLLPYNYEILLKKNCEVLFEEEDQNNSLTSNLNFDDWINFVNGLDLQPTPALENARDLNTLIKFGSIDKVKEYELRNAFLDVEPDNLKFAIIRGNKEIFKTVLQWNGLGTIIENPLNAKNYTPFLLCCELGETEFVKLLIERNCNVFAKSGFGYSCFHIAAQRNHAKLFEDLLSLQLRLNITIVPVYQFLSDTPFKFKPHHVAFQNNSVDVLRLIKQKANEDHSVVNQSLILKMDSKDVVVDIDWKRKLININRKIQFKIKETTGTDIYQINGECEFECKLMSEEQPVKRDLFWKIPKGNILHKVIESGYLAAFEEFNDVLVPEIDEETLFKLIEFQYAPEVFDTYFTIYQRKKPKVTLDDVATRNKNWSLLYTAIKYNNVSMIEYLDREMNSEKWKTKTNEGITPLHLLFELKRKDQVNKLLPSKDIFKNLKQDHTADSTGRSLLHWIVLNRWDFCLQDIPKDELLSIINDVDCFGETPLDYARNTNYTKIIEKLEYLMKEVTKRIKLDDC